VNARGRNRTPLFSDVLERLEVNPSWYPPPRLAANLSPDPSRGIVEQGGRLIQLPGPENVLGRVKFLFPNPHAVYLHDTNNRALFDRNTRAYSSGCVRIEDPIELAALLVSRDQSRDYDETMSWLNGILETTRTEVVPLQTQLPVHLEYYTVYVADDGIVEFHGDIYRLNRTQIREVARRHDIALDHSFNEEG
jgi:murein L,D-transpeptidase YcbB/YkuD